MDEGAIRGEAKVPKQVLVSLLLESGLITLTTLLLAQPKVMFATRSERARSLAFSGGLLFLCLTFCWSVIFGCVLYLNDISFRI